MDENTKNRKPLRLKHYDYSHQGLYFVTICTNKKLCLYGKINNDKILLNDAGCMLETCWHDLSTRFNSIGLHEFVVMPNHFHGIIELKKNDSILGEIIGAYKSITTNQYINGVKENNWLPFDYRLWQRNYYEHVIRNEVSHQKITDYIEHNPAKWCDDKYFAKY